MPVGPTTIGLVKSGEERGVEPNPSVNGAGAVVAEILALHRGRLELLPESIEGCFAIVPIPHIMIIKGYSDNVTSIVHIRRAGWGRRRDDPVVLQPRRRSSTGATGIRQRAGRWTSSSFLGLTTLAVGRCSAVAVEGGMVSVGLTVSRDLSLQPIAPWRRPLRFRS